MIVGSIVLAIGVMMLLRVLGVEEFNWFFGFHWTKYILPVVIILFGIKFLFSTGKDHQGNHDGMVDKALPEPNDDGILKMQAACSGSKYNLCGEQFNGAKLEIFMGGMSIDLRGAIIEKDCVIDVHAFMGGLELFVPTDIRIQTQSNCFIGGVGNDLPRYNQDAKHTIIVKANCFIGGVDIKA